MINQPILANIGNKIMALFINNNNFSIMTKLFLSDSLELVTSELAQNYIYFFGGEREFYLTHKAIEKEQAVAALQNNEKLYQFYKDNKEHLLFSGSCIANAVQANSIEELIQGNLEARGLDYNLDAVWEFLRVDGTTKPLTDQMTKHVVGELLSIVAVDVSFRFRLFLDAEFTDKGSADSYFDSQAEVA